MTKRIFHTGFYGDTAEAFFLLIWLIGNGRCPTLTTTVLESSSTSAFGLKNEFVLSRKQFELTYIDREKETKKDVLKEKEFFYMFEGIGTPGTDHIEAIYQDEFGEVVVEINYKYDAEAKSKFYLTWTAKKIYENLKKLKDELWWRMLRKDESLSIHASESFKCKVSTSCGMQEIDMPGNFSLSVDSSLNEFKLFIKDFGHKMRKTPHKDAREWFKPIHNPIDIEARKIKAAEKERKIQLFADECVESSKKLVGMISAFWNEEQSKMSKKLGEI